MTAILFGMGLPAANGWAQGLTIPVVPVVHGPGWSRLGTAGAIPVSIGADEMQDRLRFASLQQARDLFVGLGIARAEAGTLVEYQDALRDVVVQPLPVAPDAVTPPVRELAVLFVPHSVQGSAALFLLSRDRAAAGAGPAAWRITDSAAFPSFTHDVRYDWIRLPAERNPLLFMHNVNASHGAGFTQDESELYAVRRGRLTRLLHTIDYESNDTVNDAGDGQTVERLSSFQVFPNGAIEETQVELVSGTTRQVRRRFWRARTPEGNAWAAGGFITVSARP